MGNNGRGLLLRDSLALAGELLRSRSAAALTLALEAVGRDDPLRLDLPPLVGEGNASSVPDAATLRVMAALYLQAELEHAGIIPVAELLAQSRARLGVTSAATAARLEEFARRGRDWYDRQSRDLVFARVFGTGPQARGEEGRMVNRDFQQRLADFCSAVMRGGEDLYWRRPPGASADAALRRAALDLLLNLGQRRYGSNVLAASRIQEQLQRAVELLGDPGLCAPFRANGMWDLLRVLLEPQPPDFGRLTARGQSGLRLLNWLASALPRLQERTPTAPLLTAADAGVRTWAAAWLEASGFRFESAAARG